MPSNSEMLTRREIVEYLGANDLPIGLNTLHYLCARGEGPPHAGIWNGQYQYERAKVLAWARGRFRTTKYARGGRRRVA
jgi:hypothetical protein